MDAGKLPLSGGMNPDRARRDLGAATSDVEYSGAIKSNGVGGGDPPFKNTMGSGEYTPGCKNAKGKLGDCSSD